MRNVFFKIKKVIKIFIAIINLYISRLKFIGKPKGIAQVVQSFNSGGLEQVAVNIYKSFKKEGYKSTVITVTNNLGPMCQQLDSPAELRIIYYDVVDMINYCAKNNIGTLIYHFTTFNMILFKILGFKNYYVIHNTYLWYTEKEWKHLKFKLKFTIGLIAVSEWCKSYFEKKTGIKDIKVILNGINLKNLYNDQHTNITRESLKIKKNDIVCLTVGSYTPGKHQMKIIGIAERIIKKNKNVKFVCAGPILDYDLYYQFMEKLKKSPAAKKIIVLNYIDQNEIGDFIDKICDIYLQPSIHEAGVPLTVMEALLKGKPVVMTDFMIKKTFPNIDRITPVIPQYDNILDVKPETAMKMCREVYDKTTNKYVDAILKVIDKLDYYKESFNIEEYYFLSLERMAKEYVEYIKI